MPWTFAEIYHLLDSHHDLFLHSKHGIEKECLRVNQKGHLALTPHPKELGSALMHPSISTDFSEAQLELITPTFHSEEKALGYLSKLHRFIYEHVDKELLWSCSSPSVLPASNKIPLAQYGTTKTGREKTIYRRGLGSRYGRKMQTMSGIHYNYSFSDGFFSLLHKYFAPNEGLQEFITDCYMKIIRNFLRWGWMNAYFFGASPAADKSYFDSPPEVLKLLDSHTYYHKYATSIRMSPLGYYSRVQRQRSISFNKLSTYLDDLEEVLNTVSPDFQSIGLFKKEKYVQLNSNILQIEAEHYSRIRPKADPSLHLRPLEALRKGGIHYLEVRSVDIDPFESQGATKEQLMFLHLLLVDCLFKKSPSILKAEEKSICSNQRAITLLGRDPKLTLQCKNKKFLFKEWAFRLLADLRQVAVLLDKNFTDKRYQTVIDRQEEKLNDVSLTVSAKMLQAFTEQKSSFNQWARKQAVKHKKEILKQSLSNHVNNLMKKEAQHSLDVQAKKEHEEDLYLPCYEDMEISTQMIIREAHARGLEVTVLDRKNNFIKITAQGKTEYLKQATQTDKDTLLSYFVMENKSVTKYFLEKDHLPVPMGRLYHDRKKALEDYPYFSKKKIVVKPNATNYGVGISFVPPREPALFEEAVKKALMFGEDIIVEDFILGEEYRFLVINNKVEAICLREPANVIGDGKHTIRQLVKLKNFDPKANKIKKYRIQTGKEELLTLQQQGHDFNTVLKKNQKAHLRKSSNVSTGGDPIDVTDDVHADYLKLAVEAVKSVGALFCGVDMMIQNPKATRDKGKPCIIELNFNPALFLHRYPCKGKTRYVEKAVLDVLGF